MRLLPHPPRTNNQAGVLILCLIIVVAAGIAAGTYYLVTMADRPPIDTTHGVPNEVTAVRHAAILGQIMSTPWIISGTNLHTVPETFDLQGHNGSTWTDCNVFSNGLPWQFLTTNQMFRIKVP
jgi:hypothetical protein